MDFYKWVENRKFMAKGVSTRGDEDTAIRMAGLVVRGKGPKEIAADPVVASRGLPRVDSVNRALRTMGLNGDVRQQIQKLVSQTKEKETHKDQVRYDMQNNRNRFGFNPKRDSPGVGGTASKQKNIPPPGFIKIKKPMDYGDGWEYNHVPEENIDQYTNDGWEVVTPKKRKDYSTTNRQSTSQPDPNIVPIKQRPMIGEPYGSFTDNDIQGFFGNRKAN